MSGDNMSISNEQIAEHLQQISHLFLKAKEQWRSRAFSKVAGELRVMKKPIEITDGKVVDKIDGVGDAINDVIIQFVNTGTSEKMKKLRKLLPDEVIERFDAKTCKRKVNELLQPLTDAGIDWGYAGSMRRGQKTVRDVDVIVVLNDPDIERAIVEDTIAKAGLKADVRNGDTKIGVSIPVKSQGRSFTLDLNFAEPEYKGAYYLYFTGPKAMNIKMRADAKSRGMLLNQKGLFKGKKVIAQSTEREIFEALGMKYIEPEKRA